MSGFAYKLKYTTAMTPIAMDDEGAGKIGKVVGAIVSIAIPFAAPAIWGALAASTAIGASISGALTGAFGAGLGSIIGSAGVGALMGAASAVAQGARGGDIWRGALTGGLGAGIGQFASGLATANTTAAATSGVNAIGGTGPVVLAPTTAAPGTLGGLSAGVNSVASGFAGAASNGASPTIMQAITRMVGNNPQLVQRLGAAVVNAAVNGDNIAGMEAIVAQQRAELQALQQQDAAAYAQRISAAQQVVAAADRMDPNWLARVRMADVMGIENQEARQGMRNIAVRQGGALDAGQRKAYERSKDLHIGRSKALAYGRGWAEGTQGQAQLYGQASGLFTGPNFAPWEAGANLDIGLQRYRNQTNRDTAAGFTAAFGERRYAQPTSPETNTTNTNQNNDDPFTDGSTRPFGG